MTKIAVGQVWQNGRATVKVQGVQDAFQLVTFDLDKGHRLRYREEQVLGEGAALKFLQDHGCKLTDKKLVVVDN